MKEKLLKDGEPCDHSGCLNHVSHPCEGCGRIAGREMAVKESIEFDRKVQELVDAALGENK